MDTFGEIISYAPVFFQFPTSAGPFLGIIDDLLDTEV